MLLNFIPFSIFESKVYADDTNHLIQANTVSFKDNLSLNFLAVLDNSVLESAYVNFSYTHYGEPKTVKVPVNVSDKYGSYYRFRCELTASEMMIDVLAELYVNNSEEPVSTFHRSIYDYIEAGLQNSTNELERTLLL